MSFFKAGFKFGVGLRWQKLSINFSFRLSDYSSNFHTDVAAIKVAPECSRLQRSDYTL